MVDQLLFDLGLPIERGDPCIRKARGNENSLANKPNKVLQMQKILEVYDRGKFTGKEVARILDVPYHTISGRYYTLRKAGKLRRTGVKRENASEYEKV